MARDRERLGDADHPAFILHSDIMVPMRDGTRLATDVYLPAAKGAGAFPAILERTPYGKTIPSRSERSVADPRPMGRAEVAGFFAARGYAVIYQDCRGTHGSEGKFTKYLSEGEDGYDTIQWIAAQPWCDGTVGTMGLSYAAHTQMAAACLAPPALKAMFVDSGGFHDAYQGGIRQGGAFELKQATWAMRQAIQSPEAASNPLVKAALEAEMENIEAWFSRLPWRKGQSPLRWLPEFEDYLLEQWRNGAYGEYWRKLGICSKAFMDGMADVPAVFMSSWYDPYPRTATENYLGMKSRGKGPVSLILGPWTHGDRCLSYAGDVDFGPSAPLEGSLAPSFLELRLEFFDRWLKPPRGGETGRTRPSAEVRYFRMGGGSGRKNADGRLVHGGQWREADAWPLPGTEWRSYELREDGTLDPVPAGAEGSKPPRPETRIGYRYDPSRPVPSIGGTITSGEPIMRGGAFDQVEDPRFFGCAPPFLPLASRPDVLVFETEVLEEDTEITGPVTLFLNVSSDCPDTDFTFKLIDLYPPSADYPRGFAMNLTDGILRARYRNSWEHPELMEPGKTYRIEIEAFPTSNLFRKGHKIRLDLSSSNFPHFDANPNTGEPEGMARGYRVAFNAVHLGGVAPSRLVLPVVRMSQVLD
ncbi:MAG TPA: CocE/NonD family hydrolase [Rectinemataceae bacterium]